MKINNKELTKDKIECLVEDVKNKKELRLIEESFVLGIIKSFLIKNPKILRELSERKDLERFRKSSNYRKIIKYSRAILHKSVGIYPTKQYKKNKELLRGLANALRREEIDSEDSLNIHKQILATHKSTKERLKIYGKLYEKIFEITQDPETILDLGCGLNPISYPWMNLPEVNYYAIEVNEKDLEIIKEYFSIVGINGHVKKINLQKVEKGVLDKIPKADVCFLFKILDALEITKGHKLSEDIIKRVRAEWLVVSFATKTISGRTMHIPKRIWFEKMLKRLGLRFSKFREENELFYVFRKN